MAITQIVKHTDSVITYGFDWSRWLAGFDDLIESVSWDGTSAQIVTADESNTTTMASIRLLGLQDSGVVGTPYQLVCTITTEAGLVRAKTVPVYYKN
jgi:hypothetical protein